MGKWGQPPLTGTELPPPHLENGIRILNFGMPYRILTPYAYGGAFPHF
jgi:hypothetical protein